MPSNTRLQVDRGNTLIINYTNQDTNGNAISLAGATVYFTVKTSPGYDTTANDSTALWKIDTPVASGNTCTITSTPANTWQTPGTYFWDITIDYGGGSVVTAVQGNIQIIGIPTNRAS